VSRLWLIAAAVLFSTGGAAIKAASLTSWQVASFRSGLAALALFLLLPGARRGWSRRTPVVGLAYAVMLILFVLATRTTTAANAIFLQSTSPLYLILLGPLLLKEPIRRGDVLLILVLGLGIALFFIGAEQPLATAPNPFLGNLLATASGVGWALTMAGLRWIAREAKDGAGAMTTVAAGNAIAFLIALPMALPVGPVSAKDAAVVIYLGVFQIGLAYVCLTRGLRRVPAFEASTIVLLETALNPFWAWLVHGETPGRLALAGGAIIVAATIVNTWWRARRDRFV
jgi:DME family drug/metabolite transporter